jgi:hypothetical protein
MKRSTISLMLLTGLFLVACKGGRGQSGTDSSQMKSFGNNSNSNMLLGAGSTLVYPFFSKLFAEYGKETRVMVNYRSIGSGGGISELTNKIVDFGDSDVPLNEEQIKKISAPVLQIVLFRRAVASGSRESADGEFIRALIYKEQNYDGRSLMRAQKLLRMLWWNVHEGQKYCDGPGYAQLSPADVAVAENTLKSATFDGKPILR